MSPKFAIGDVVWMASFDPVSSRLTCPDCGGTRFMTARLFDGTEHAIACQGCDAGYEGSRGWLQIYERTPSAREVIVSGVHVRDSALVYDTSGGCYVPETNLFSDETAAYRRGEEIAETATREELERLTLKERDTRSWAWHVHYHRSCIRRAQAEIERHTARLAVAKAKAKEPA